MARYKHVDTNPKFLPVDLPRQLLPGTFEHALNLLLDKELDLSSFDARYRNDKTGAAAYPPATPEGSPLEGCCSRSFCLPTPRASSAAARVSTLAANT